MRILLINPVVRSWERPSIFPLGLAYIASVLIKAGHHVDVLDLNALRVSIKDVRERIKARTFDVVGISCLLTEYGQVKELSALLKREHPDCTIMLGGGLPSVAGEFVLQETEADIAVVGEGEETVVEIVDKLEKSADLHGVKGILFKDSASVIRTDPREPILDLDSLPLPAWELFPIETYLRGSVLGFDSPIRSLNMITSRGCPYQCCYCDYSIFGHRFRARSVSNVLAEMELLKDRYSVRAVNFVDDLFLLDKNRVCDFCDQLLSIAGGMMWSCNARVNLVDSSLLKKMRSAGCMLVGYGVESGSQRILDEMNKKTTVEQGRKAIEMTWNAGITPFPYMMFGMPGETEETIRETVDFCKDIGIVEGFGFATPIPGTALYERAVEAGKILDLKELVEDWHEWQKKLLVNMTALQTERLIALREAAEKSIVNHALRKHKALVLKKLVNHYRIHGMRGFLLKLAKWCTRLIARDLRVHSRRAPVNEV